MFAPMDRVTIASPNPLVTGLDPLREAHPIPYPASINSNVQDAVEVTSMVQSSALLPTPPSVDGMFT